MDAVKVTAILDSVSTRKDKSLRLVFESNEVGEDQFTALFQMRDSYGVLIFAPPNQEEVEVPDVPKPRFKEEKSHSQRLRGALFRLFEQLGSNGDFEKFYDFHMNRIIDSVKEKLKS